MNPATSQLDTLPSSIIRFLKYNRKMQCTFSIITKLKKLLCATGMSYIFTTVKIFKWPINHKLGLQTLTTKPTTFTNSHHMKNLLVLKLEFVKQIMIAKTNLEMLHVLIYFGYCIQP